MRDQLVGLQDLFPTCCALAGRPAPDGIDGSSLLPFLADGALRGRDFIVATCRCKNTCCARDFKYIHTQAGGREELYDLRRPEPEAVNLAANPAYISVRRELRAQLARWCRDNGDAAALDGDDLARSPLEAAPPARFDATRLGWRPY
ncbi:MAG: hypothetical protein ACREIA_23270 [Opitutaceae bacterium]